MIFIKKMIVAAVLIFPYTAIYAQQLTLSSAIILAKERNLHIQTQKKSSEASKHNQNAAKSGYLPSVSLVGGYTHLVFNKK